MEKNNYILGLDLGTGSVGWGCVVIDENGDPIRILDLGSRIFNTESGSLEDRRIARGRRRLLRRRRARCNHVKVLFKEFQYLNADQIKKIHSSGYQIQTPYEIRAKGKKEKLSYEELFIILYHYCKGRGFRSNRKSEDKIVDKKSDVGLLLSSVRKNTEILDKLKEINPDATIIDVLNQEQAKNGRFRNSTQEYLYGFQRTQIKEEVEFILEKQIEFGLINGEFKEKYINILMYQRSFSEGPDTGPYHHPLDKMIGTCRLTKEPCASIHSLSYLKFILVQKLRDLRYKTDFNEKEYKSLNTEIILNIINHYFSSASDQITYGLIAKMIDSKNPQDVKFKISKQSPTMTYHKYKEKYLIKTGKTDFGEKYFKLKKHFIKHLGKDYCVSDKQYDLIADCFSRRKTDFEIESYLRNKEERFNLKDVDIPDELIESVLSCEDSNYSRFGSLSYTAIYMLLDNMLDKGMDFYHAKKSAFPEFADSNIRTSEQNLPEIPAINQVLEKLEKTICNHAVTRTLVEARKVVNSIIKIYGFPKAIHIETARELTLSDTEKKQLVSKQDENYIQNHRKRIEIFEKFNGIGNIHFKTIDQITSEDLLRYDLFKRQRGYDLYAVAQYGFTDQAKIKESEVFSSKYEVDHIIPYSVGFDDRKWNKVLVSKKENAEKQNQIPGIYYQNSSGYSDYCNLIKQLFNEKYILQGTMDRLLATNVYKFRGDYRARTINDTRYIARAVKEIFTYSLPEVKQRVFVGQQTAKLRALWRLNGLTTSYESHDYKAIIDDSEERKNAFEALSSFEDNVESKEYKEAYENTLKVLKNERKKNRTNHLHHAIDAVIVACMTDKIRRNVEIQEIINRQHKMGLENQSYIIPAHITDENGEIIELKYEKRYPEEIAREIDEFKDIQESKFPQPYIGFNEELKIRALEMDEETMHEKLKNLSLLPQSGTQVKKHVSYSNEEIQRTKPVIVSHFYQSKLRGKMHEETYCGLRDGKYLVKRERLNSEKFESKHLKDIYDKDKTQKYIYQAISEWMNGYKNGMMAYKSKGYPKNKNGHDIRSVTMVKFPELKEQMELKQGSGIYVAKNNVLQTLIFKREGDKKLYFCAMGLMQLMKAEKGDIPLILWYGQGKNNIKLKKSELRQEGFELYRVIYPRQTVLIQSIDGNQYMCLAGGISSGKFECFSITGDNYDLVYKNVIQCVSRSRIQLTVSTISDITPISIDPMGKVH